MENKINSIPLIDRWNMDVDAYKKGGSVSVKRPQCESCEHYIKANALHCLKYQEERKPKYVMFSKKECPQYSNKKPSNFAIKNE